VLCAVVGGLLVSKYMVQPEPVVELDAVTVVGFETAPAAGEKVGVAATDSV
jgi:hypothetical protein